MDLISFNFSGNLTWFTPYHFSIPFSRECFLIEVSSPEDENIPAIFITVTKPVLLNLK